MATPQASARDRKKSLSCGDDPKGRPQSHRTGAGRSLGIGTIKTAAIGIGFECLGYSDDGLSGAQGQHAIRLDDPCKALEDAGFGLLVEVDQNVSAEYHIERTKMREVCSRLSCRCCTIARISELSCHRSPTWVKCLTSI